MELDNISISSDFSIIPESMVHALEEEINQSPISMNASFFKNEEHASSAACSNVKSPFNKVLFGNMQREHDRRSEEYSLSVVFTCELGFEMTKSDRIAMYKVGFSSSKDYICFVWVPIPNSKLNTTVEQPSDTATSVPVTVKFEGKTLPRDQEELYQICYLKHDGQIAGASATFQLQQIKRLEDEEIENAARQVLSIRMQSLVQEQKDLRQSIQDLEIVCDNLKCENEGLNENYKDAQEKLLHYVSRSQELEEQLTKLQDDFEQIKLELIEKDDRIEKDAALVAELQSKLITSVMEINSLREKLEMAEEEKSVTNERQKVIMQDNVDLKTSLMQVKEDLDQALKEKEAAEKVASDLSHQLQNACDEYQLLAKQNNKLLRKMKKIKREMDIMEAVNSEGYFCIQEETTKEDEHEEKEELEEVETLSREDSQANAMIASTTPSIMPSVCHSTCSQSAKDLTEAFSQKMEDIVSQLSLQKEQIKNLKVEIEKSRNHSHSSSSVSHFVNDEYGKPESSSGEKFELSATSEEARQVTEDSNRFSSLSDTQKEAKMIKVYRLNAPDDDKKVLYGQSFLPTSCTAPVFFPPPVTEQPTGNLLPSAPPTSLSMEMNDEYSIIPANTIQNNISFQNSECQSHMTLDSQSSNQAYSSMISASTVLPPPLLPETTVTARNAAVLKQFINESTMTNPIQNLQEELAGLHIEDEKEEDHFESNCQSQEVNHEQSQPDQGPMSMLSCPLCHLTFEGNGFHLLQEHINSHLEKVCPICSTAFARNTKQEEFEVHVHSHFRDEDEQLSSDPSGPWGQPPGSGRSFHLLEID